MAMGGQGPMAVLVMWIMVVPTLVCVVLRFYTRVVVIQSHGADDHVYNLAFICLLCYTIFITIAADYGFGQSALTLEPSDLSNAILFEAIGQTFAVVGMAVAKWSLGLFLLRIIHLRTHKVLIWVVMAALMGASISTCFVFWLQCTPPKYLWDRTIPGGYCQVDSTPVSMLLCKDTVGLIIWSAAEIAVTMICIAVPVCRPLYNRFLDKFTSRGTGGSYERQNGGSGQSPGFALHTFGGSTLLPRGGAGQRVAGKRLRKSPGGDRDEQPSLGEQKMGGTSTYAIAIGTRQDENHSDEEIMGAEERGSERLVQPGANAIRVTEEIKVTRS
ncbi:hypothetical protein SLS64_013874 [Diaporthe eres]